MSICAGIWTRQRLQVHCTGCKGKVDVKEREGDKEEDEDIEGEYKGLNHNLLAH